MRQVPYGARQVPIFIQSVSIRNINEAAFVSWLARMNHITVEGPAKLEPITEALIDP